MNFPLRTAATSWWWWISNCKPRATSTTAYPVTRPAYCSPECLDGERHRLLSQRVLSRRERSLAESAEHCTRVGFYGNEFPRGGAEPRRPAHVLAATATCFHAEARGDGNGNGCPASIARQRTDLGPATSRTWGSWMERNRLPVQRSRPGELGPASCCSLVELFPTSPRGYPRARHPDSAVAIFKKSSPATPSSARRTDRASRRPLRSPCSTAASRG